MKQKSLKVYDLLTKNSQKKIMALNNKLCVDRFIYLKKNKWKITYYDTPDNLLTKTGILIYKTIENDKCFFKVEKLSFLPSVSRLRNHDFFEVPVIAPKSTPKTQAFYLINGITEMFTTQFYIDLENVLKNAIPKVEVSIVGKSYKGFRGDGFKFLIEFQKVTYKNFTTKRKFKNLECTVSQKAGQSFDDEFAEFIKVLEKYCKEIIPQNETRFEKSLRITQPIVERPKDPTLIVKRKKEKQKKEKQVRLEDRIED